MSEKVELHQSCIMCSKDHVLTVTKGEYDNFRNGMHIQDAMPNLSADERELLVSGICGKCFDKLFEDDEE